MKSEPQPTDWLTALRRALKQRKAKRDLARDVEARKRMAGEPYARRRAAALKGLAR